MKQIRGLWWPDDEQKHWIGKISEQNGVLCYQHEAYEAAVAACGPRRRIVVDGGAHIGLWSLRLVRDFDLVVAFEPDPDNAECFCANLGNRVRFEQVALSDVAGTAELCGWSHKSVGWTLRLTKNHTVTKSIITVTLDLFELKTVDLIKLDVEGHEYEALVGMHNTLLSCRPVVVLEEKHDPERKATRLLQELGMRYIFNKKHDFVFVWGEG